MHSNAKGSINYIKIALIIASLVYFFGAGCTVNPYTQAESLLNHQEHKAALKQYLQLIKQSQKSKKNPDIRAMVGAAIAYRNLGQYRACVQMCQTILKYDSKNAAAYYYLGVSLEEMGKRKLALKYYNQFSIVSPEDPYYSFMRARANILKMQYKNLN